MVLKLNEFYVYLSIYVQILLSIHDLVLKNLKQTAIHLSYCLPIYPCILLSVYLPEIAADCTVDKKVDTGIDFHKKPKTIYFVFREKEGTMGCLLY